MARRRKNESKIPPEILQLIKVTPEMTEEFRKRLKYTITPRPQVDKAPRGKLWCPYCADWKKFGKSKKTPESSYNRCETCNISTEDFHVRTVNMLWGNTKG
jgi:Pyruvate/2-oxoacid:ferredoxin oxidoreductase delta subunit